MPISPRSAQEPPLFPTASVPLRPLEQITPLSSNFVMKDVKFNFTQPAPWQVEQQQEELRKARCRSILKELCF